MLLLVPFCTIRDYSRPNGTRLRYIQFHVLQLCSCECRVMAAIKHVNVLRIRVRYITLVAWLVADGWLSWTLALRVKRQTAFTNLSSAAVKNEWCYTSISPYAS